jgi:hypothetical protein
MSRSEKPGASAGLVANIGDLRNAAFEQEESHLSVRKVT